MNKEKINCMDNNNANNNWRYKSAPKSQTYGYSFIDFTEILHNPQQDRLYRLQDFVSKGASGNYIQQATGLPT
ncbi:unnamed protein product [Schistosoma turkestanicum]|nr:unnamed protein product [Schistosoma turkestanicum]